MQKNLILIISGLISLILISILAFLLFFTTSTNIDLSTEETTWILEHKNSITLSGDPNYPPFDFVNNNGLPDGIFYEIIKNIESKLGMHFNYIKSDSWALMMTNAENNKVDMISCISPNADRYKYLNFSTSFMTIPTFLVTTKHSKHFSSIKDLFGKKIAISKAYASYEFFKKNYPEITIIEALDDKNTLKILITGECDAAISDLPSLSYNIQKYGFSNLHIDFQTDFSYELSIGIKKDYEVFTRIIQKALNSIPASQKQNIISKWINIEYQSFFYNSQFWLILISILSILATIIFLFTVWDRSLNHLVQLRTEELTKLKDSLEELVKSRTMDLEEANKKLEKLAQTDPLTNAFNRRYFIENAEKEIKRCNRSNQSFSLIMLDIDHFKNINDTYGHAFGDEVLICIVNTIQSKLRAIDIFARVGGEEFYILIPYSNINETFVMADRFRALIEEIDYLYFNKQQIRISASFGVSEYLTTDSSIEDTMLRCDLALYQAKREGRNRVCK